MAKYICLEQQTLAWKKKSNANSHNDKCIKINNRQWLIYVKYFS